MAIAVSSRRQFWTCPNTAYILQSSINWTILHWMTNTRRSNVYRKEPPAASGRSSGRLVCIENRFEACLRKVSDWIRMLHIAHSHTTCANIENTTTCVRSPVFSGALRLQDAMSANEMQMQITHRGDRSHNQWGVGTPHRSCLFAIQMIIHIRECALIFFHFQITLTSTERNSCNQDSAAPESYTESISICAMCKLP